MNNWSHNKNELQTESSQELFSCLWCDADSSVCESISCFSGFLRCSFWYFQLSQDFSPLVTCFCTTSVSKPEIWSSRVASGREVTCRGNRLKMAEERWTASTLSTAPAFSGQLVVLSARKEVKCRCVSCLLWPLPPTCTPAHLFPLPQQLCSVCSTYSGCRPGPSYSLPDCLLCLLLIVQPSQGSPLLDVCPFFLSGVDLLLFPVSQLKLNF